MWFFSLLVFACIIWLLWVINQNTEEALNKQTAIHAELVKLNKHMETMSQPPTQLLDMPQTLVRPSKTTESNETKRININSASIEELTSLQGIGKSTAQKIIDARPFSNITALAEVQGVSQDLLDKISSELEC
mgnify:CR=1 FL=1